MASCLVALLDYMHFETCYNLTSFIFLSENQSRLAARKYARVVQKLDFPVSDLKKFSPTLQCLEICLH